MAEFLPPLIVELRATITEFTAKMGEAKAQMEEVSTKGASTFESMGAAGGVALAALGVAAGAVGTIALHSADQFEMAHARLQTAIANTGSSFDAYKGQITAAEKEFEHLGFTHTEYQNALARMTTGLGSASLAIKDMGTAANVAAMYHMSLEKAATVVTKAAEGNSKAIKLLGIDFKSTGDKANDAATIMGLLNDKLGGAAQAQAETFAGQMKSLHATLTDVAAEIGTHLVPIIEGLAHGVEAVVGWFDKHQVAAVALAGVIAGPLVGAITLYIVKQAQAFVESAITVVSKMATAISTLFTPAVEEAAVAEESLATSTAFATGGLSVLGALAAMAGVAFFAHSQGASAASASTADLSGAAGDASTSEGGLAGSIDDATAAAKAQQDQVDKLSTSLKDQIGTITGMVAADDAVVKAKRALDEWTGKSAKSTEEETRHSKELETAQGTLKTSTENLAKAKETQLAAEEKLNKLKAGLGNAIAMDEVHAHHNLQQATLDHETAQTKYNDAVAQYGSDSVEAQQASLDLENTVFSLTDAQDAMGHVGETAWGLVDQAQQAADTSLAAVKKATDDQATAQAHLNDVQNQAPTKTLIDNQATYNQLQTDFINAETARDDAWTKLGTLMQMPADKAQELLGHLQDLVAEEPNLRSVLLPFMTDLAKQAAGLGPFAVAVDSVTTLGQTLGQNPLLGSLFAPGGVFSGATTPFPAPLTPAGLGLAAYPTGGPTTGAIPTGTHGIPSHQFGGIVAGPVGSPQVIVAHGGERVIPVGGGTGGGVTMNGLTVNVYTQASDPNQVAEIVREKLLQMGRGLVGVGLS